MRSFCLALMLLCGAPERAAAQASSSEWPAASNARGARGPWLLDAAHPLRSGALMLQVASEVAYATGFFEAGDSDLYNREQFSAVYAPMRNLEIGLSGALQVNRWHRFVDAGVTLFGEPTLRVKYSAPRGAGWGFGGLVTWLVPSAVGNAGFAFGASTLSLAALASYLALPGLELTGNLGLVLDASDQLAARPDPDKRMVYQVNQGSGITLGAGALWERAVATHWALTPFVEVAGLLRHAASWDDNPWQAVVGLKTYMLPSALFELVLGTRIRLSGAPQAQNIHPGMFPWTGFLAVTIHAFDAPPAPSAAIPCDADADCPQEQRCVQNICHYVTEVITTRIVQEKTFRVAGTVLDIDTRRPVDGAEVVFVGFERTPVAVNRKTGAYTSFPLACGDGLLKMQVRAPNYKPFESTLPRADPNRTTVMDIKLRLAERPDIGRIEGSIKDSRTGQPVRGAKVTLISLGLTASTGDNGQFARDVPVGHHDLLISAPGYVTQRKKIVVHDADVLILDVDLVAAHRKHRPIPEAP